MSKLRDEMLTDLQLKGIIVRTQKTYLREVRNLAKYFGKSPDELGEREIKEYLLHLRNKRKVSEGTYRFYSYGLRFFNKHTMKRDYAMEKILFPKQKKQASRCFGSQGEGRSFFSHHQPQTQSNPDDDLLFGITGQRGGTS